MDDLEALQREFMTVQNTRPKRKIPERMAMEIVQLAASTHPLFVGNPLLHSLNGRDFLTKSRLFSQIKDQIRLAKGRVRVDELPSLLQIGAEHIQSCLSELTKERAYHLIGGHLIVTDAYIQRYLWSQITSQIQMKGGYTLLTQISNALDLPLSFIKSVLKEKDLSIGKSHLTLSNNLLYSQEFVSTLKATLRAFVQAVLRPITLSQLLERFRKHVLIKSNEQVYLEEQFTLDLMNELIESGEIRGFISQGVYTSKAFIQLQRGMIKELFNKRRILEYSYLLSECKISKPKNFIETNLEGGVFLAHAYVHHTVIDETYALIRQVCIGREETKSQGVKKSKIGCINLENTLSVSLRAQDVDQIMEKFPQRKQLTIIDTFVLSRELVKELEDLFIEPAQKFAEVLAKKGTLVETQKKKKGQMVVAKKKIQSSKLIPNQDEIKQTIKKNAPLWKRIKTELSSGEEEDAFLTAISGHLKTQVNQLFYKKATELAEEMLSEKASETYFQQNKKAAPPSNAVATQMAESLKEMEISSPSDLNSQIEREIQVLQQAKKVLEFMEKKKTLVGEEKKIHLTAEIQEFLRENYLFRILNKLTLYQAIYSKMKLNSLGGLSRTENGAPLIISDKDRATVQKQFPTQHTREVFKQLEVLANDGGLTLFLDLLKEELCNLAVSVRLLDKKTDKAMTATEKTALKQELESEPLPEMKDAFEEEEELKQDEVDSTTLKMRLVKCSQLYSLTKDGLWLRWLFGGTDTSVSSGKLEIYLNILKMSTSAKEGSQSFEVKEDLIKWIGEAIKKEELDGSVKDEIKRLLKSFLGRMAKY